MSSELFANSFKIAEKAVKTLLNSYFVLFQKSNKLDICEKMGISTKRVPEIYSQQAELISLVNTGVLSKSLIQGNSLLSIPEKSDEIRILTNENTQETYLLSLIVVPFDHVWDEKRFESFGDQIKNVKGQIGNILNMAQFVFGCLKKYYQYELKTMVLDVDPINVTLKIRDELAPKYDHHLRIGFQLVLEES